LLSALILSGGRVSTGRASPSPITRLDAVLVAVLVVGFAVGAPVGAATRAASEAPTVEVSVGGTHLEEGDRHETHSDDELTVEAAVGGAASANVTLVEVVVRVDSDLVESRSVELIPAEERTVRYETAFAEPGNYTVSVNDTQAGPVVVEEGGGLLSVFSFVPLRLVGLILGGVAGLLLVLTRSLSGDARAPVIRSVVTVYRYFAARSDEIRK